MLEVSCLAILLATLGTCRGTEPAPIAYLLLNRDGPRAERSRSPCGRTQATPRPSQNLRRELHGLRRALPHAERLLAVERKTTIGGGTVRSARRRGFEDAAEHAGEGGVDALRATVALYRGDLLPEIYDDWIERPLSARTVGPRRAFLTRTNPDIQAWTTRCGRTCTPLSRDRGASAVRHRDDTSGAGRHRRNLDPQELQGVGRHRLA